MSEEHRPLSPTGRHTLPPWGRLSQSSPVGQSAFARQSLVQTLVAESIVRHCPDAHAVF
jgi:hypothetical protein